MHPFMNDVIEMDVNAFDFKRQILVYDITIFRIL